MCRWRIRSARVSAMRWRRAARGLGLPVTRGGTYLVMEGPQFSTKAESELYRSWGCSVIGMTNMPEAKLAREAELNYATVAMVTDFDCWHPDHDHVTVEAVVRVLLDNADKARALVQRVVPEIGRPRERAPPAATVRSTTRSSRRATCAIRSLRRSSTRWRDGCCGQPDQRGGMTVTTNFTGLATWPQNTRATDSSVRVVSGVLNLAVAARQTLSPLETDRKQSVSRESFRRYPQIVGIVEVHEGVRPVRAVECRGIFIPIGTGNIGQRQRRPIMPDPASPRSRSPETARHSSRWMKARCAPAQSPAKAPVRRASPPRPAGWQFDGAGRYS